jgi:hypothetical protein
VSPTLFWFPAHAPAVELEFTPGRTTLTIQISVPTTTKAFLDPVNGLSKVPTANSGARISYPTSMRGKLTLTNEDGVDTLEGNFAPADVYGVDTAKSGEDALVRVKSAAPRTSVIELAKVHFAWELAIAPEQPPARVASGVLSLAVAE